jgi:hypothetical protein
MSSKFVIERVRSASETLHVDVTWIEKYVTFEQAANGTLKATDYHFLAEVCYRDSAQLRGLSASLFAGRTSSLVATYDGGDPRAFTNGFYYTRKSKSYDGFAELEAAHPAQDNYFWQLSNARDHLRLASVRIGGPNGQTAIPEPSPIFLSQQGKPSTCPDQVRPDQRLTISWRPFSNGCLRAGTDWQDLIFVLISDANGEVVFTGGAPGSAAGFLDFSKTSADVPAGTLKEATAYVAFISQVKFVDHNASCGIEQLAANSFAVELPISTVGESRRNAAAARRAPYLWSGKTPREQGLVPWPGFLRQPAGNGC